MMICAMLKITIIFTSFDRKFLTEPKILKQFLLIGFGNSKNISVELLNEWNFLCFVEVPTQIALNSILKARISCQFSS